MADMGIGHCTISEIQVNNFFFYFFTSSSSLFLVDSITMVPVDPNHPMLHQEHQKLDGTQCLRNKFNDFKPSDLETVTSDGDVLQSVISMDDQSISETLLEKLH